MRTRHTNTSVAKMRLSEPAHLLLSSPGGLMVVGSTAVLAASTSAAALVLGVHARHAGGGARSKDTNPP
jgi:hypothetical protein